jgi:hypothetical protein
MNSILWFVSALSLLLPPQYKQSDRSTERIPFQELPNTFTTQEFRAWKAPGGKSLYVLYWVPTAPHDGGSMVIANEKPIVVAGQATELIETSMFMGSTQHVFVTYLKFHHPETNVMIYGSGLNRKEFISVLSGVKFGKK